MISSMKRIRFMTYEELLLSDDVSERWVVTGFGPSENIVYFDSDLEFHGGKIDGFVRVWLK